MGTSVEGVVVVKQSVLDYLDNLVTVLYEKNYFRFVDSAESYVNEIFDFIQTIPTQISYDITNKNSKHYNKNLKYCRYKANRNTTWFVYFEKRENRYIVKHIENSHTLANYGYN